MLKIDLTGHTAWLPAPPATRLPSFAPVVVAPMWPSTTTTSRWPASAAVADMGRNTCIVEADVTRKPT